MLPLFCILLPTKKKRMPAGPTTCPSFVYGKDTRSHAREVSRRQGLSRAHGGMTKPASYIQTAWQDMKSHVQAMSSINSLMMRAACSLTNAHSSQPLSALPKSSTIERN